MERALGETVAAFVFSAFLGFVLRVDGERAALDVHFDILLLETGHFRVEVVRVVRFPHAGAQAGSGHLGQRPEEIVKGEGVRAAGGHGVASRDSEHIESLL